MRLIVKLSILITVFILGLTSASQAHFGMILPDKSMVMPGDDPNLGLTLAFLHPMEQKGMPMAKPKAFGVKSGKEKTDLLGTLQETKVLDNQAWKTSYAVKKAGCVRLLFRSRRPTGNRRKINSSSTRPRPMSPPLGKKRTGTRKWASRPKSSP